jgi:hypothetical protein
VVAHAGNQRGEEDEAGGSRVRGQPENKKKIKKKKSQREVKNLSESAICRSQVFHLSLFHIFSMGIVKRSY